MLLSIENLSDQNTSENDVIFAMEQFQGKACGLSGNAWRLAPVQFDGYISPSEKTLGGIPSD